jgi:glyoxylase-like metal-dependent hydrolase (beta-lactamase superfamily II)
LSSITTEELARRVDEAAEAPFILDVRAPDQFEAWRIEGRIKPDTVNIPYWTALGETQTVLDAIPQDKDVVVVCAHGDSSDLVVETLGLANMHNLAGGMDAWSTELVPHVLLDDGTHFVIQFDRIAKACLSYVIGARGETMAVIDPAADLAPYLRAAAEMDAAITDIFDTHLHADHVSLARAMATETGATYHISAGDAEGASYDYAALHDGERFTFGSMELVVRSVATPGHTPGSTSLEVGGKFLMTGDAVFVSGIGRPDLGGETEPWARDLFHTIHDQLAPLNGDLEVCPAHYTSRSEARPDATLRRTLSDLLVNDPVVSMQDEEEFVQYVVDHLGRPPEQYDDIRKINMGWIEADAARVSELEVGRNECALSA